MRLVHVAGAALLVAACGRTPAPRIVAAGDPLPASVEVHGLPSRDLRALASANLSTEDWQKILAVRVEGPSALPMAGEYLVEGEIIRFTPMFGFDAGRDYTVTFYPEKLPLADPEDEWRRLPLEYLIAVPEAARDRTTQVQHVYPSGPELPENMLRFYIEFSAPMGRSSPLAHIRLVDERGREIEDPFLPVGAELWSPDRMRFTLLFDPGRVKRDIKPNRDMGRALIAGTRYVLVIDDAWRDGSGTPLKSGYRHEFTAGPAIERPLDPNDWIVTSPRGGSRDPLRVAFPWALDHGLLQRAIRVRHGTREVSGEVQVAERERVWNFIPAEGWSPGRYMLEVASDLEDPAGNRPGRAFEVTDAPSEDRMPTRIPFTIRP